MNLLNIEHISKIYGEKIIFDDASFGVQEGDKIGIVGINGPGKGIQIHIPAGEHIPGKLLRQAGGNSLLVRFRAVVKKQDPLLFLVIDTGSSPKTIRPWSRYF